MHSVNDFWVIDEHTSNLLVLKYTMQSITNVQKQGGTV